MRPAPSAVTNWAGNIVFSARAVHRPTSLDQLAELVAGSDRLRVLGSGHSFSPVADTEGDLVSLAGLPPRCEIGEETVTVGAGMRYGDVMIPLHAAGRALRNTGSLPHIAVAGACSTGTHGSGDANPVLATSVSALELLGPDGRARTVRRGDEGFDGSVVALGALGVVTALTLDTVEAFDVRQTVLEGLPRFEDAPEALAAAYSVSLFTYWEGNGFEQVWVKQRAQEPPLPQGWLGTTPASGPRHMIRGEDGTHCTQQGGVVVPWYQGLPHFRLDFTPSSGEELQSEWLVPRESLVDALHGAGSDPHGDRAGAAGVRGPHGGGGQHVDLGGGRPGQCRAALHLGPGHAGRPPGRRGRGGGARPVRGPAALGEGVHRRA